MHTMAYVVDKDWCYWYTEAIRMSRKLLLERKKMSWKNWDTFTELKGSQNWDSFLSSCWYVRGLELAW